MNKNWLFVVIITAVVFSGCKGSVGGSVKSGGDTPGGASAAVRAEALKTELQQRMDKLSAPLSEANASLTEMEALLAQGGESSAALSEALTSEFKKEALAAELDAQLTAEQKQRVHEIGTKLSASVTALQQLPGDATALAEFLASAAMSLPQLVVEGKASAQVTANNPFASAEEKAQANADLQKLDQAQAAFQGSLGAAQSKAVEVPQQSTALLARLTTALPGITLPPPPAPAPSPAVRPEAVTPTAVVAAPASCPDQSCGSNAWLWIGAGSSAVVSGVTAYFWIDRSNSLFSCVDRNALCAEYTTIKDERDISMVISSATGGLAVGFLLAAILSPSSKSPVSAQGLACTPFGKGVQCNAAF